MPNKDDLRKSLQNQLDGVNNFLKDAKEVADAVPGAEAIKKDLEAKLVFVFQMPEVVIDEQGNFLYNSQQESELRFVAAAPKSPLISLEFKHVLASGTTDTSAYHDIAQDSYVFKELQGGGYESPFTPEELTSIKNVVVVFEELAQEKSRKADLPPRLNKLNSHLGDKFMVAVNSYDKALNAMVGIDQSAIQMRDVIEQLWGGIVNLVRLKDSHKYKSVELNLDNKGRTIAIACLAPDDLNKQRFTLLLETLARLKKEFSDPNFGKNPLAADKERLVRVYGDWILVISDLVGFLYLNGYITD